MNVFLNIMLNLWNVKIISTFQRQDTGFPFFYIQHVMFFILVGYTWLC